MDTVVGSSSGTSLHPLAASNLASSASASRSSPTDTRPRLKRLLSGLQIDPGHRDRDGDDSREQVASSKSTGGLAERIVIVHEVCSHFTVSACLVAHLLPSPTQILPKDSLPGVSLKYGISLADLRRANHLWPSDPIHLRKVLYIPLDKSNKAKDLVLSQLESSTDRPPEDPVPASLEEKLSANGAGTPLTIRRIPAAQLSFFPPPSAPSLSLSASTLPLPRSATSGRRRDAIPFDAALSNPLALSASTSLSIPSTTAAASTLSITPPRTGHGRGPIPSLSTIFSSLPIGRISFDSSSSTPSAVSDDQEHELHDVSHRSSFEDTRESRRPDNLYMPSPSPKASLKLKKAFRQPDTLELRSYSQMLGSPLPKALGSGELRAMPASPANGRDHKPSAYVSPARTSSVPESIRTSQPQPSLGMQLPLKVKRSGDDAMER